MKIIDMLNKESTKELMKRYVIGFIVAFICFIVFLNLGYKVKGIDSGIYFDKMIIENVSDIVTPHMRSFMIFISFLGSAKFYIPLSIVLVYYFYKKQRPLNIIVLGNAILGSAILNALVKRYYARIRPEEFFQILETGFSFPSGHSMVGISSYFILTYLFFRNRPWDTFKIVIWIITVLFVVLIGISRIYLGVHWPTDVLGGFSLGFIWVYVNIIVVETFIRKKRKNRV